DPETPITLDVVESPARLVLEAMIEQCALNDPCTWQLRTSYIEVGTKERLGAPAAAVTRIYNARDLMLEAPYFESSGGAFAALMRPQGPAAVVDQHFTEEKWREHPYHCAALSRPALEINNVARKRPEVLIDEIVEGIVEVIEPGNWDVDAGKL